ncbi:hypothetical protein, partial [Phocaeicola dorei]|uniref:hypothetical protein n=1 Tax=Phocaeicola dorei TaxID=357276 RepID=UPI00293F737A
GNSSERVTALDGVDAGHARWDDDLLPDSNDVRVVNMVSRYQRSNGRAELTSDPRQGVTVLDVISVTCTSRSGYL